MCCAGVGHSKCGCRCQVQQTPNGSLAHLVLEVLNPFVEEADREMMTEVKGTDIEVATKDMGGG